jgi:hypothetical protein
LSQDLVVYQFEQDTFNAKLQEFHLLYHYDVPRIHMPVMDLIKQTVNSMKSSPFNYKFTRDPWTLLLTADALPLCLLEFVNKGSPHWTGQSTYIWLATC